MKPNIILLGSVYPEELRLELLSSKSDLSNAAHVFQSSLISGLQEISSVTLISSPKIWLKRNERCSIGGYTFKIGESPNNHIYIGFKKYFNKLHELRCVNKELRLLLHNTPSSHVLIYSLYSPFLLASLFCPKHKTTVVVPDLPEYMSGNTSLVYKSLKKLDRLIINLCLKHVDSFVLFSQHMKDKLPIQERPQLLIEGIYKDYSSGNTHIEKETNNTLLYTGGICQRYGVFDLINAFTQIKDANYTLWLCGDCDDLELLNSYLKTDYRIKYFGCIDMQEVRILQRRATLLINPRRSTEEFAKYSFPSKTLEYMASGTPTLMCKLPATPEDYIQHLYFFEDESIEGYKSKILEICSKNKKELYEKGMQASCFVRKNKNEISQAKRLVNFLINNK